MSKNEEKRFSFDSLPEIAPVFPLAGALLLPRGLLPLHVFEDRYVAMVEDALRHERVIGMIQPREPGIVTGSLESPLFETGCLGKITGFEETDDGRFLITLTGLCRFHVKEELEPEKGYRRIRPCCEAFKKDM